MAEEAGASAERSVPLAVVAATLVKFARGSEATRVTVAIDQGDDVAVAVVSLDAVTGALSVSEGDEIREVDQLSGIADAEPLGPMHLHSFPSFEVEPETGQITGALGALEHLARSVVELANLFGGRTAAAAEYETADGGSLEVGGNTNGDVALSSGGVEFETPEGWPGR